MAKIIEKKESKEEKKESYFLFSFLIFCILGAIGIFYDVGDKLLSISLFVIGALFLVYIPKDKIIRKTIIEITKTPVGKLIIQVVSGKQPNQNPDETHDPPNKTSTMNVEAEIKDIEIEDIKISVQIHKPQLLNKDDLTKDEKELCERFGKLITRICRDIDYAIRIHNGTKMNEEKIDEEKIYEIKDYVKKLPVRPSKNLDELKSTCSDMKDFPLWYLGEEFFSSEIYLLGDAIDKYQVEKKRKHDPHE